MQDGNRPPLTARSVLASTLLGATPPELPVSQLVHVTGLFGINENRARVALSRMVSAGEATTDGVGRYRLAGHLLERQQRQSVSRAGRTGQWHGGWHVVVLTTVGSRAEVRGERRRALARSRLGELRQGVWLRPDNLPLVLDHDVRGDAAVFVGRPEGDPVVLAAQLWDLAGWASTARELVDELAALPPRVPDDLAPGFVLSAAVLRHFQADPLLPAALLGPDWPGSELRHVYDDWDARYRKVLADWSRAR
ncbi:MAG: PaaX family transcriptional regulator C-terminal domain-containing protein [Acidimicrobiales bacterium]